MITITLMSVLLGLAAPRPLFLEPPAVERGALVGFAGRCMMAGSGATAAGVSIVLSDCRDTDAEKWTFAGKRIRSSSGHCLSAQGHTPGSAVRLSACNGSELQEWNRAITTQIWNADSGLCLTASTAANRAPIMVTTCDALTVNDDTLNNRFSRTDSDRQKWFLEPNVVLHVQPVAVANDDSSAAPLITRTEFALALDSVNDIFRPAHIRFVYDTLAEIPRVFDTVVNSVKCTGVEPTIRWGRGTPIPFEYPGRVVVLLRHGGNHAVRKGTGASCSAAPWFGGVSVYFRNYADPTNGGVLAHELGHYLGLEHTFIDIPRGSGTVADSLLKFLDSGRRLDGDGLSDTPDDPGTTVWSAFGIPQCGDTVMLSIGTHKITPDRSNVMGYFGCGEPTLSRKQRLMIRRGLAHASRRHLTEAPLAAGGAREIFGMKNRCLNRSTSDQLPIVDNCAAPMRFIFGARGDIRVGTMCLTESEDRTISARPFFTTCNGTDVQRWTRTADARIVSFNGLSLWVHESSGHVFQGFGVLGPEMIWGSYFTKPRT